MLFAAHSPDNSFMGFVIPDQFNSSIHKERKNQAVVYGKMSYMWQVSCALNMDLILVTDSIIVLQNRNLKLNPLAG